MAQLELSLDDIASTYAASQDEPQYTTTTRAERLAYAKPYLCDIYDMLSPQS